MPRVVITHAVADIDRWLKGNAGRTAAIESGSRQQRNRLRRKRREQQHRDHRRRRRPLRHPEDAGLPAARGGGRNGRTRRDPPNHGLHRGVVPRPSPKAETKTRKDVLSGRSDRRHRVPARDQSSPSRSSSSVRARSSAVSTRLRHVANIPSSTLTCIPDTSWQPRSL